MENYNNLRENYLTKFKDELQSELSKTRIVKIGYDWDENGNAHPVKKSVPILSPSLDLLLRNVYHFFKNDYFLNGIQDSGTCTLGECLYIQVAEKGSRSKTNLPFIKQQFQGSTSTCEYFSRIKSFLKEVHPELNSLIHYDCGTMD